MFNLLIFRFLSCFFFFFLNVSTWSFLTFFQYDHESGLRCLICSLMDSETVEYFKDGSEFSQHYLEAHEHDVQKVVGRCVSCRKRYQRQGLRIPGRPDIFIDVANFDRKFHSVPFFSCTLILHFFSLFIIFISVLFFLPGTEVCTCSAKDKRCMVVECSCHRTFYSRIGCYNHVNIIFFSYCRQHLCSSFPCFKFFSKYFLILFFQLAVKHTPYCVICGLLLEESAEKFNSKDAMTMHFKTTHEHKGEVGRCDACRKMLWSGFFFCKFFDP